MLPEIEGTRQIGSVASLIPSTAPPGWAERKVKEQLTREWSRRVGPVAGEPLEVDLGCSPPFVVRPQPVTYVNGVRVRATRPLNRPV